MQINQQLSIRQYLEPLTVYCGMHGMYTFVYLYQGSSRHKPNLSVVHGFELQNYDIHALSALCALCDLVHRVVLVAYINDSCPWNAIRVATCHYDATSCPHLPNHHISRALLIQPKMY